MVCWVICSCEGGGVVFWIAKMTRALTEEPKETEEETATDEVNFQCCVLEMCFFSLTLLF